MREHFISFGKCFSHFLKNLSLQNFWGAVGGCQGFAIRYFFNICVVARVYWLVANVLLHGC